MCSVLPPHVELKITDEEVISLYWLGILDGYRTIRQMYTYDDRRLREWFPTLLPYSAYVMRLNRLADLFLLLWCTRSCHWSQTGGHIACTGIYRSATCQRA